MTWWRRITWWWFRFIDWLIVNSEDAHQFCDHVERRRVNQSDCEAGWLSVCRGCGASFLDMDVVKSAR